MRNRSLVHRTREHLSSAEMDRLLFPAEVHAASDEAVAQHLRSCMACAEELGGMRTSLGLLKTAATEVARQRTLPRRRGAGATELAPLAKVRSLRVVPLAIAASLLGAAVLIPSVWHGERRQAAVPVASPARSVADDEALLREIDEQLSESVPSALVPLANPMKASSPSPSNNTQPTTTIKD